jgi:hypothetical protein
MNMLGSASGSPLVTQFSSPKSLLARHCLNAGARYRHALTNGVCACLRCGRNLVIGRWFPGDEGPAAALPYGMPSLLYGIHLHCLWCDSLDGGSPWHLSLDTPEVQRFWRRHPRMRALPTREVEAHGRPALVIGYESASGGARLEIVADRATYQTLQVFGEVSQ